MRAERWFSLALVLPLTASAAGLTVDAVPAHLQLGSQAEAQLVITGPADLSDVVVSVNHGVVVGVKQVAPGRFVAQYRPPGQTFPRVAIAGVTGVSKGKAVQGWTSLPLWGSAEAMLQTLPNASVSLRIAARTYGPLLADGRGLARVAVVVPPGVQSGFYGNKVLDLGLPRVSLSHVVLERSAVRGHQANTVLVHFYSVNPDGTPRLGGAPLARVTHGAITAFKPLAPGVGVAQWTVPVGPPADAELSAWLPLDPSGISTVPLRLLGGPPAKVALGATPDQLLAGSAREARISAEVTDARGNATDGEPVFSSSVGTLERAVPVRDGLWTVVLRVPGGFGAATAAVVRATLAGLNTEARIPLIRGLAHRLEVTPDHLELMGSGAQTAELRAQLLDVDGNPVPGALTVTKGALAELPPTDTATRYLYRPARSLGAGVDSLEITSGGLVVKVPVVLEPAPARVTFGPRAGFASNLGNANALTAALELGFWPSANLGIGLEAGYFFLPRDSTVATGARVLVRAHGAPLLATLGWRGKLASTLAFQASAAGGVVAIHSTLKVQDQQQVVEDGVAPSAKISVSVGYALGRATPFLEAEVRWVGEGGGNNLAGSLFTVGVSAGCRFELF